MSDKLTSGSYHDVHTRRCAIGFLSSGHTVTLAAHALHKTAWPDRLSEQQTHTQARTARMQNRIDGFRAADDAHFALLLASPLLGQALGVGVQEVRRQLAECVVLSQSVSQQRSAHQSPAERRWWPGPGARTCASGLARDWLLRSHHSLILLPNAKQ